MSAYAYIIKTSLRNFLKQQLKKPALMIVYAVLAALIIWSASQGKGADEALGMSSDIWKGVALVYFAIQFYITLKTAMTKGTTVFGLEDVQLLFVAPVKSQMVLLYGGVRQMARTLLIPLFLLFQMANLRNLLGMHSNEIIALFIAIFVLAFSTQVIAMNLYALLAQNSAARKRVARALDVLAVAFLAVGVTQFSGGIEAVAAFFARSEWNYVPLFGWLRGALVAAEDGNALICALLIIASLVAALPFVLTVWRKQPDFYEDVLDSTQDKHNMAQLVKSGNKHEAALQKAKIRVGRQGIGAGFGASAFFFRQILEQRRSSRLFLDMMTFTNVVVIAGMCYFMGRSFGDDASGMDIVIFTALGTLAYIQMVFYVSTGQYVVEQKRPFLFLAPCKASSKIFACNALGAIKCAVDAFLAFLIAGAITGFSLIHAPLCALLFGSLSLLFTGANLLADWLVGDRHSKFLGMMLFFLATTVLLAPVVGLFFLSMWLNWGFVPAYLLSTAYALLASFLTYMPLGEILHNSNVEL